MDFIVLSSSHGTTLQAILDRLADGTLTATCLGLVSDSEEHGCVAKARNARLPFRTVERKEGETTEEYDKRVYKHIMSFEAPPCHPSSSSGQAPEVRGSFGCAQDRLRPSLERATGGAPQDDMYIVCVGWMHIFSPWFVEQFPNRILNVHPALLPKFGGKGMYGIKVHESVLNTHEKESGMTIHIVNEHIDAGPILIQKRCPVLPLDTPETLKARVQELEKEWYPKVLQMIEDGVLRLPT